MGVNVLITCLICLLPENPPGWIKSYFPDFTMVFLKEFEGKFEDIDIAHKTGEMVIACRTSDGEGIVYYLDKEGILKWSLKGREVTDIKRIGMIDVEISDNGENVYIFWSGDWEYTREQVYDREGRLLFDAKGGMEPVVSLFPSGGFTYSDKIYDKNGKEIDFSPPFKKYRPRYKVVSDSEIVVMGTEEIFVTRKQLSEYFEKGKVPFRKEVMYLVNFPDGKVKMKMEMNTRVQEKVIHIRRINGKIFIGTYLPRYSSVWNERFFLYCYDEEGKLRWKAQKVWLDKLSKICRIENTQELVVIKGNMFYLINEENGKVLINKNLAKEGYPIGRIYSFFSLPCADGVRIFIGTTGPAKVEKTPVESPLCIYILFIPQNNFHFTCEKIENMLIVKGKETFYTVSHEEDKWKFYKLLPKEGK